MSKWLRLHDPLTVGDTKTLKLDAYYEQGDLATTICTCSSVYVLGYDPNRPIEGVVDAAGNTTLTDTSVLGAYADDALIGLPFDIISTLGVVYEGEITDNVSTLSQITFRDMELTPTAGDEFRIVGEPLLSYTTGTASSNRVSHQVTASNMTAERGKRVMVFRVTYEDGDTEEAIVEFEVVGSHRRRP
jgi:hypothetical protein